MGLLNQKAYLIDTKNLQNNTNINPHTEFIPWDIYLNEDKSKIIVKKLSVKLEIENKLGILYVFDNGQKHFIKFRTYEFQSFLDANFLVGVKRINPNKLIYSSYPKTDGEVSIGVFNYTVKKASYVICNQHLITLQDPFKLNLR